MEHFLYIYNMIYNCEENMPWDFKDTCIYSTDLPNINTDLRFNSHSDYHVPCYPNVYKKLQIRDDAVSYMFNCLVKYNNEFIFKGIKYKIIKIEKLNGMLHSKWKSIIYYEKESDGTHGYLTVSDLYSKWYNGFIKI